MGDRKCIACPAVPSLSHYVHSKTVNILFAAEFDRRYKAPGIRATARSLAGAEFVQAGVGDELRQVLKREHLAPGRKQ